MALPLARLVVRQAQSLASPSCSAASRIVLPASSLSPIAGVDAAGRRLAASQSSQSTLRRSFKESRVVGFPVEVRVHIYPSDEMFQPPDAYVIVRC